MIPGDISSETFCKELIAKSTEALGEIRYIGEYSWKISCPWATRSPNNRLTTPTITRRSGAIEKIVEYDSAALS
jgi:hypothetical protein